MIVINDMIRIYYIDLESTVTVGFQTSFGDMSISLRSKLRVLHFSLSSNHRCINANTCWWSGL